MAHFVVFNTETDFGNGLVGPEEHDGASGLDNGPFGRTMNEQIEFLKKDLAGIDRKKTREQSSRAFSPHRSCAGF